MEHTVERLVVRSRDGDVRAFDMLVERFQRRVFYTILRVVRCSHTADDLTQEVFITVHRKIGAIKDAGSFVSWIHRIAMNKAIDAKRRVKREQERVFLVEDFTSVRVDGDGDTERRATEADEKERTRQLERQLREAIDDLPKGQRTVLLLSMDGNLSQEEIAEILSIPRGTVKSRLHHARKVLTARLRYFLEGA